MDMNDPFFAFQALSHIGEGLAITDHRERFKYVNPELEQMTGYSGDELLDKPSKELVCENYHSDLDRALKQRKKEGKSVYEIHLKHKSGEPVVARITSVSLWKAGEFMGSIAVIRDISEAKNKEAELRKALEKAEEAKKEKEKFLASMSHEIRTPMTGVLGMTQMLLQTDLDDEQRNYLESIDISARNLTKILNDILDYTELDSDKISLNRKPFDLAKSVRQLCTTFRIQAEEKGLEFKLPTDDGLPEKVTGDEDRYLQSLLQILANALKFTDEGSISVSVTEEKRTNNEIFIKTVVEDTGGGISEELKKTIFDSFEKASKNTMTTHGGTGLGLPIVKKLVELMDGTVSVSNREKGMAITMSIPFDLAAGRGQDQTKSENVEKPDTKILKGRTILVADDHPINQKLMEGMLSRTGAEVLSVEDGNEAITVFKNHPEIDVIMMDVHMPGMSGLEATRKIRSEFPEKQSDVVIIAVTASVMSTDVHRIKDAGMDDYLAKPFTYREFIDKISEYLDKKNRQRPAAGEESNINPKQGAEIDFIALRDMTGGDKAMMLEVMKLFLEQTPGLLGEIKSACETQDWQELSVKAHKLKPTFYYMGMVEAYEISLQMETYKDRPSGESTETAKALLDRLTELARKTYPELERMVELYRKMVN